MKSERKESEMAAGRERWRRIVERVEASGLAIRQFCEQHGVDEGPFYHWRHRLELEASKRAAQPAAPAPFVLVQPAQLGQVDTGAEAGALELVVERGGRMRIPRGFDEATPRAVLGALAQRA